MNVFKAVVTGFFFFLITLGYAMADEKYWLLVDTTVQNLMVMEGKTVKHRFENISIGRNGTSTIHRRGDNTTPLGHFRIAWVNPQSKYKTFFGLDYPNQPIAQQALQQGLINSQSYDAIANAIQRGGVPPQNTALGGYIGIHGLGNANEVIHDAMNWTEGCVALTNKQIDELAKWIEVGTRVVISEGQLATLETAANNTH